MAAVELTINFLIRFMEMPIEKHPLIKLLWIISKILVFPRPATNHGSK
jgi:hypothetical protein